jgi:hypothetical protein
MVAINGVSCGTDALLGASSRPTRVGQAGQEATGGTRSPKPSSGLRGREIGCSGADILDMLSVRWSLFAFPRAARLRPPRVRSDVAPATGFPPSVVCRRAAHHVWRMIFVRDGGMTAASTSRRSSSSVRLSFGRRAGRRVSRPIF